MKSRFFLWNATTDVFSSFCSRGTSSVLQLRAWCPLPLSLSKVVPFFSSACWYFWCHGDCFTCAMRNPRQEGRKLSPWRERFSLHLPWLRKHPRNSEGLFSWHHNQRNVVMVHPYKQSPGHFKYLSNGISNHGFQVGKALRKSTYP